MGPESKNEDYTLCLDGMPIAWREPLPEITVREEGVAELAGGLVCEPVEFTAHFKTPKRWRCGSRKRFIKLLVRRNQPKPGRERGKSSENRGSAIWGTVAGLLLLGVSAYDNRLD